MKNNNNADRPYADFVFYATMKEGIDGLPQKQGEHLLRAIVTYGSTGEAIKCNPDVSKVFEAYKPFLDFGRKHRIEDDEIREDRLLTRLTHGEVDRMEDEVDAFLDQNYTPLSPVQIIGLVRGHELRHK